LGLLAAGVNVKTDGQSAKKYAKDARAVMIVHIKVFRKGTLRLKAW
jgi:hypothetical protein